MRTETQQVMSTKPDLKTHLTQLWRGREGSVVVMVAGAMVVLFGCAAMAVDMGNFYAQQNRLQVAADAAALAAIDEMGDVTAAQTTAQTYATTQMATATHGNILQTGDVVFGVWNNAARTFTAGAAPRDAVQVTTRKSSANGNPAQTFFGRVFGLDSVDITASATAIKGDPPACVLALDPDDSGAISLGNGDIVAPGCTVHANSNDPDAIDGNPNGGITADSICVAGGYDSSPDYTPTPDTGCTQLPDPLEDLAPPSNQSCVINTTTTHASGNNTLSPDVYCADVNIFGSGTMTFNAGTYVFKNANLDISGTVDVVGNGVTFYFTGTSELTISGGNNVTLTAPTDGDFAGILVYGDRSQPESVQHTLNGTDTTIFEGTIYTPTANVQLNGTPGMSSGASYTALISRTVEFNGIGDFAFNSDYENSNVPVPYAMTTLDKLVE